MRALLRQCRVNKSRRGAIQRALEDMFLAMYETHVAWVFAGGYMNGTAVPSDTVYVCIFTDLSPAAVPVALTPKYRGPREGYTAHLEDADVEVRVKPLGSRMPVQHRMSCKERAIVCCTKHLLHRHGPPGGGPCVARFLEVMAQNYFFSSTNKTLTDDEYGGFLRFLTELDLAANVYTAFRTFPRAHNECAQYCSSDMLCMMLQEGQAEGVVLDDYNEFRNVFPKGEGAAEALLRRFSDIYALYGAERESAAARAAADNDGGRGARPAARPGGGAGAADGGAEPQVDLFKRVAASGGAGPAKPAATHMFVGASDTAVAPGFPFAGAGDD